MIEEVDRDTIRAPRQEILSKEKVGKPPKLSEIAVLLQHHPIAGRECLQSILSKSKSRQPKQKACNIFLRFMCRYLVDSNSISSICVVH